MAASYETPETPTYPAAEEQPTMFAGNPALVKRAQQRRKMNPAAIGVPIAVLALVAAGGAYLVMQSHGDKSQTTASTTTTTTTAPVAPLPVQAEALATLAARAAS